MSVISAKDNKSCLSIRYYSWPILPIYFVDLSEFLAWESGADSVEDHLDELRREK